VIERASVLIFTPTYEGGLRHETVASIVAQQTRHWVTWEIGRCNPYPGRDMRNVLAQYAYAREMCLRGPYDAMVTVEHDMTLPPHAIERLCDTPAPVVYGTYLLRHGEPVLNAWRYEGTSGLGMSLERYPLELRAYREAGVGRVSGCGFGCTLIRRAALEAIPFRQDGSDHAPDMPFALDCVRKEVLQLARFDVRCGHITKETTLEIQGKDESTKVMVTCIQPVNVIEDGGGISMVEGETYAVSPENAATLTALGYVKPAEEAAAKPLATRPADEPSIGDLGQAPKVPRK
jgi:hypothetical protein